MSLPIGLQETIIYTYNGRKNVISNWFYLNLWEFYGLS